ncbi:FAD binding domain-containing protein [Sinorhizobium meliloti]|uniref:FAD binding domain-containing protein n=1 Tax=Rhizobium meliloti TaxID=382 RepID=UPI000FD436AE|nr:xanthine dehydrogenase family protein subunit M [Sinorhizobium meliloti]MQV24860.1 xanthine dehydrogenase family protein subunit M [Sinorhizobium meliloti]MQV37470.1 xanthine dehydrogenase family protein subunit M [Sinorhizobium meliloti]RVE79226.1 xanthine dehydrogenase family protein subunit M [Sinorhizobium meliloti]RVG42700.1 xanthine dehydrogenase family protein subunit M [Sinorhizobium meliloti]RVM08294.1 xanthine dehydrogenase family protein subunit M [Sinorhizobium meliloti]
MKPASFDYFAANTVADAAEALAAAGGDGKIIAGGQSLMPMINFRLVKPTVLVDVNRIPGLDRIELRGTRLKIGATVRHYMTATDGLIEQHVPILHDAMHHVAHMTVRNRGTFCGSVCHADPAAEMPMMTLLLDGTIIASSIRGERQIPAAEFFVGSLMNALEPDEFVTAIEIDTLPPESGWGFEEFSKRQGDFALACVATTMRIVDGVARDVRFGMMGVGETPLRLVEIQDLVEGNTLSDAVLDRVAETLSIVLTPNTDIHASADYRRHLSGALARRALRNAWTRAETRGGRVHG